ncbi:MAG TPA: biotin--[acetyl-CoA-carboxylase] ligase [Saprospiraceae bacterium]|nr:biotin--[acetyl-CoA-carboxylase] ligase [Saprospiraceae bacterium]
MNTHLIGKVCIRYPELPSTNDHALQMLEAAQPAGGAASGPSANAKPTPAEGTVIRADTQSAGRGQYGSRWQSAPGQNLLLSVILYPTCLAAGQQFALSMMAALAVRDAAHWALGPMPHAQPLLKWPNDLYFGTRKAGGMLIQNAWQGSRLHSSVVGIGLNVNQTDFDADLPNPTSLARVAGHSFDLDSLAERLFECLDQRYAQLRQGHCSALQQEYETHLLGYRQEMRYRCSDGQEITGQVLGVSTDGRLRMQVGDGQERLFSLKEVSPLWD